MDAFKCSGWLHITLFDSGTVGWISMKHLDDHIPYFRIDLPDDVKAFVRDNLKLKPAKVRYTLLSIGQC